MLAEDLGGHNVNIMRASEAAFLAFLLGILYLEAVDTLHLPESDYTIMVITAFFFLFALIHAWSKLGAARSLFLLITSYAVSILIEILGVSTGIPFGAYAYTDKLGYKILGLVPVLIPVAWFMMLYCSWIVARTLLGQTDLSPHAQRAAHLDLFLVPLLGATAMTAWDLIMDPMMVAYGYWFWKQPGPYFGIPLMNFVGWFSVTFVVLLLFELAHGRMEESPHVSSGALYDFLPIGAYIATWLETTSRDFRLGLGGVASVGFFTMGLIAMISCIAYFSWGGWQSFGLPESSGEARPIRLL